MEDETKQRWQKLAQKAQKETDPVKLGELVDEINRLFDDKDKTMNSPPL